MTTTRGLSDIRSAAFALKEKMSERVQNSGGLIAQVKQSGGICRADCPVCQGLGWIRKDVPRESLDFGKIFPCPNLASEELRSLGEATSGLLYTEEKVLSWESIKPMSREIIDISRKVKSVVNRGYGLVFLHGSYGTAKTMLLQIPVAEAVKSGITAYYTTATDMLEEIRSGFDSHDPRESSLAKFNRWKHAPILALDEIEKARDTDFTREKLFQLIDFRYRMAINGEALTLIATNAKISELDPAIADRMSDGRVLSVHITGPSARPLMK